MKRPHTRIVRLAWAFLWCVFSLFTPQLFAQSLSEAEASLKAAEQSLASLYTDIDKLRHEQIKQIAEQKENDAEIQRLNQRIDSHREQLAKLIQMEAQWRLLPKPHFNPGKTTTDENLRRYWLTQLRNSHYMLARSMQILTDEKQRIAEENQAKQTKILDLIKEQEGLSESILGQIKERKQVLTRLKREQNYQQNRLKEQSQNLARLNPSSPAIASGSLKYTRFSELRGQLPLPTLGKEEIYPGRKSSLFFKQEDSQPVYAVARGKVVFADWISRLGNIIIIDHGGDYISLYGHNRNLTRQLNEQVEMGDIIAYSGNTGGQDEIGLLFEIRKDGELIQARNWLTD